MPNNNQDSQAIGFLQGDLERKGCPKDRYSIGVALEEMGISIKKTGNLEELCNKKGETIEHKIVLDKLHKYFHNSNQPSNEANSVDDTLLLSPEQETLSVLSRYFGRPESEISRDMARVGIETIEQGQYVMKGPDDKTPVVLEENTIIGILREHYQKQTPPETLLDNHKQLNINDLAESFQVPTTKVINALEKGNIVYASNTYTQIDPSTGKETTLENHQVLDILGKYLEAGLSKEQAVIYDRSLDNDHSDETTREVVVEPDVQPSSEAVEIAESAVKRVVRFAEGTTEPKDFKTPSEDELDSGDELENQVKGLYKDVKEIKKEANPKDKDLPLAPDSDVSEISGEGISRYSTRVPPSSEAFPPLSIDISKQIKNANTQKNGSGILPPRPSPSRNPDEVKYLEQPVRELAAELTNLGNAIRNRITSLDETVRELDRSKETIQQMAGLNEDLREITGSKQRVEEYFATLDKAFKSYFTKFEKTLQDITVLSQSFQDYPVKINQIVEELIKSKQPLQDLADLKQPVQELADLKGIVGSLHQEIADYFQEPIQELDTLRKVIPHVANLKDSFNELRQSVLSNLAVIHEDSKKYFSNLKDNARKSLEGVLKGYTARINPSLQKLDEVTQVLVQEIETLQRNYTTIQNNVGTLASKIAESQEDILSQYAAQGNKIQTRLNQLINIIGIKAGEDSRPISVQNSLANLEQAVRKSRGSKFGRTVMALTFFAVGAFGGGYLLNKYTNLFKGDTTQADVIAKTQYAAAVQKNKKLQHENQTLQEQNLNLTETLANSNYERIKRDPREGRKIMTEKVEAAGGKLRVYGDSCKGVFSNFYDLLVTEEQAQDVKTRKKFVETDYNRRGICKNFDPKLGYIKFEIKNK